MTTNAGVDVGKKDLSHTVAGSGNQDGYSGYQCRELSKTKTTIATWLSYMPWAYTQLTLYPVYRNSYITTLLTTVRKWNQPHVNGWIKKTWTEYGGVCI